MIANTKKCSACVGIKAYIPQQFGLGQLQQAYTAHIQCWNCEAMIDFHQYTNKANKRVTIYMNTVKLIGEILINVREWSHTLSFL